MACRLTAFSDECPYKFDSLWPKLPQPWSFYFPAAIALDSKDNIYVLDQMHNIIEMDKAGKVLGTLSLKSKTESPQCIAFDKKDNLYALYPDSSEVML